VDEFRPAQADRIQQGRYAVEPITAIAVDEQDDAGLRRQRGDTGLDRPSIAAAALKDDARPRGGGPFPGRVPGAAIDDEDRVGPVRQETRDDAADRGLLVEAGHDGGDEG